MEIIVEGAKSYLLVITVSEVISGKEETILKEGGFKNWLIKVFM